VFRITVEKAFTATHQLTLSDGSKEKLHSHHWLVRATVAAGKLDSMGLVMDFQKLGGIIDDITAALGGRKLEETDCFGGANASAENVAKYLFERTAPLLDRRVRLEAVEVMETPGCWAKYSLD
jgi:6-pyruvoyltetrahydropterin/6-carboxytetrahydropterin synthase